MIFTTNLPDDLRDYLTADMQADDDTPLDIWCHCECPHGLDVWVEGAGELCDCGGYIYRPTDYEDCAEVSK